MKNLFLLMMLVVVIGCKKRPAPQFIPFPEKLDSLDVNPGIDYDYYEFRAGPSSEKVYLTGSKLQLSEDLLIGLRSKFDTLHVGFGFSEFPHIFGYNYVISQYNSEAQVWNSSAELKVFFGEIDTKTEAQIYIMSLGFPPVINDTSKTAVKEAGNGYIIRAIKMDRLCNPIIVNRYTLALSPNGNIDTLDIVTIHKDKKGCI